MHSTTNKLHQKGHLFIFSLLTMLVLSGFQNLKAQTITTKTLIGQVTDEKSGRGIEAATISIQFIKTRENGLADTSNRQTITNKKGQFSLNNITSTQFIMRVSAVGFVELQQTFETTANDSVVDAGEILLLSEAKSLGNVVVTGKKPAMTLAVDRRIYNADAAITSKGGTAIDLLKNVPSLSVDVNGGLQLRNSSPQIFVDGRPTILTLEQIPAEDIEKVEIITNPSARYDAGSTGGIVNIVLKKNRRKGMNGMVSVGAGTPKIFNGMASLNYRQGKLNFFATGNYNTGGGIAKGEAKRQNKSNGIVTDYFNQESQNERIRKFSSLRFGVDYFIDNNNTLSVSQGFVDGRFNNEEMQNQVYLDNQQVITRTGTRINNGTNWFNRSNTQVNYRRSYDKPGKEWTADFTYSGGTNGGSSQIFNQLFAANGQPFGAVNQVNNLITGSGDQFTFQTDYVNPFAEDAKIEFGLRSFTNLSKDKFDAFSMNGGQGTKLPLSNNYAFKEVINAVYANYANKIGKLKYQGGLRLEQSSFNADLIDSARSFGYKFPASGKDLWSAIFPSVFLTYTLKEGHDLQLNFSRKIRRPNFWNVNPFVDISDPMNLRKGNPELRPEFNNTFETNYNRTYEKGNLLVSAYFTNNTGDITQYSDTLSEAEFLQLNNAAIDPNAILSTFINADRTNRMGLEMTLQHRFSPSFDITPSFDAQYRDVKAVVKNINLSNSGFNWEAKMTANYKIIKPESKFLNNFSFQAMGEYESPRVMPQGRMKEQWSVDFAMRKDFMKNNAASITFNVSDVFNSWKFGSITDTDQFYQDSYRRWRVRGFRLTLSYRFGKNDLQLFKSRDGGGEDREGGEG